MEGQTAGNLFSLASCLHTPCYAPRASATWKCLPFARTGTARPHLYALTNVFSTFENAIPIYATWQILTLQELAQV